ncbi:MAG: sensor histidine kinase [Bacteroidia bacterium]
MWQKISYIGIDPALSYSEYKSSIFLNRICTVLLGFVLTSLCINLIIRDYNFVLPLSMAALVLGFTYILHISGKYMLAKANVFIATLALITYMLFKAGTGAGIEFYFLSLVMLPAIIFQDKRTIYFFQVISILCLVSQKIYEDIYTQEMISSLATYRIFYVVNSIFSGLLTILVLAFFKNQYQKSEQEILQSKNIIEEKNAALETLNANLSRSNRDLEQFAYVASHALKEPLRMISTFATLLARKCSNTDTDVLEYNKYITSGVGRMQNLINDLLSYAKIGSEEREFSWLEINKNLEDVKHALGLVIAETDAEIVYDKFMPQVYGSYSQLNQLFYNLIANAIKFRRQEEIPRININCFEKENHWLFTVTDNGIGIKQEYLEKVFVIFQRLHNSEKYPGTGIGLSLCKRIVERHGGDIWLESEPGNGTTVCFTIQKPA